MEVQLTYHTDVVVTVDLDKGEVVRVQVDDENARLSEEDRESTEIDTLAAEQVAEGDGIWPAWEFGF